MPAIPASRRALLGAGAGLLVAAQAHARAPFRQAQAPGFYRLLLGSFELTVLSDGPLALAPAHPTIGGNAPAEQVQGMLRDAGLSPDRFDGEFNMLLVNTGRELVLIDAGSGSTRPFGPTTGRLPESLRAAGYEPGEVDLVVISHLHPDHAWGVVGADGSPLFPNARYGVGAPDWAFWTAERNASLPEPVGSMVRGTAERLLPLSPRTTMLTPGQPVTAGITSLASPGHTPGHLCFVIEDGGERLLYSADVANHWLLSLRRPDWHFAFDADPEMAVATRRRVFGLAASERMRVLAYHFPWPGIGRVETLGDGFRWLPEPWRWE